jgi:FtsZ-interacting cell division protein YlmF
MFVWFFLCYDPQVLIYIPHPSTTFSEATSIADRLRAEQSVVLDVKLTAILT